VDFITIESLRNIYDVVIIGGGPAGLAAASGFVGSDFRVLVVDAGKSLASRDHRAPSDIAEGYGGAGLFSDGKFSFFPSASELWNLPNTSELRKSYAWVKTILENCGMKVPDYPELKVSDNSNEGDWNLKSYPSQYLSLQQRYQFIGDLVKRGAGDCVKSVSVTQCQYNKHTEKFHLQLFCQETLQYRELEADNILFCTGRFGPVALSEYRFIRPVFRRVEVGLRIQQASNDAFFYELKELDPKLKRKHPDLALEWRTFCACRDGETVLTYCQGLYTVSGRSDCPPTNISNIGFNTRIYDEKVAANAWPFIMKALSDESSYFSLSLEKFLANDPATLKQFDQIMGPDVRQLVSLGVAELAEKFPSIAQGAAQLIGPTLEGVGWYPTINPDLSLPGVPAWVAGDACGIFRGIVAAMVSGYYIALLASNRNAQELQHPVASESFAPDCKGVRL
jgi:uncharacterized FAD-dependent dehydrogenase